LCGARDPKHRGDLVTLLATFSHLAMPDSIWDKVGDNLAILRLNGITVSLVDAAIATLGIDNNLEIWSRDLHFAAMQKILSTPKLYQEPP
jgi:predicted nucleic acid-binding protein